jgi:Lrp/AsnC family leucine-responsive transcriptional regulator
MMANCAGFQTMEIDRIDAAILAELFRNARASQLDLAGRVNLSGTAVARRQKALEESGVIKGYQAVFDLGLLGLHLTVLIRIALDSQSEEALKAFEEGARNCPSITQCFLMSGSDDYVAFVLAQDIEDFERIHRTELSRLPRVARIQSSFAIRTVVDRGAPPVLFKKDRKRNRPARRRLP